jgi:glycosyltransferase involved in cell wall biosynthesis
MVVANDVTRDSRVLREAAVLSRAGYRVTVLGIMTARTVAPPLEMRDGYVIRRLPFRARPPGWWVPPDFYFRLRSRSVRQYRIHRARVVGLVRRGQRLFRIIRARGNRVRYHAGRARRLGWARIRGLRGPGSPRAGLVARRMRRQPPNQSMLANVAARWMAVRAGGRSLLRRARRTPLVAWPSKARRVAARAWARARATASVPTRYGVVAGIAPLVYRSMAGSTRRAVRNRRSDVRVIGWLARNLPTLPIAITLTAIRAIRAWAAILALLGWGSLYLVANRASGGAVEWMTGWRWRWLGWAQYVVAHAPDADVWHGHDMTSLPAVMALKRQRGGLAVYDSHEVYFESGRHALQPRWAKASLQRLERELASDADAVITVNRSLATILSGRFRRVDIAVLHNCPVRPSSFPRSSLLRRALGLSRRVPLLLYHGSLAPGRGVEQLLAAVQRPELSAAHLAFLGFGPMMGWLREEARHDRYGRRVHVLDAVPPEELSAWLVGVDVAVAPIQPSTLNHRYSSPNKVFEAISAGTPVAGSDLPEFRRVIEDPQYGPLGVLFDPSSPEAIAAAVRSLLDLAPADRALLRQRCRRAALRRWNWETESASLLHLYEELRPRAAATEMPVAARAGAA